MHWSPKVFQWKQCEFPAASWSRKKVPWFLLQHLGEAGPKRSDYFLIWMIHEFSLYYHHGVDRISTFQLLLFEDSWMMLSVNFLSCSWIGFCKKICSLTCRAFPSLLPPFQPSHHPKLHHSPESPWPFQSEKMGKGNEWPRLLENSVVDAAMNFCHAIFRHKELPEANQIASQRGSHGEAKRAVLPHQVSSRVMPNAATGVNLNAPTMVVMLISRSETDPPHAENKPHHPFCLSKHWQMHVVRYCSPHRRPLLIQATSNSHSLIQHLSRYKTLIETW